MIRSARNSTVVLAGFIAIGLVVDIALRWKLVKALPPASAQSSSAATLQPDPPEVTAIVPPPLGAHEPAAYDPANSRVVLIDGMTKRNNGIDGPNLEGYWYTYSDGTGELVPPPGSQHLEPVVVDGRRARHVIGHGQEKWGLGFGFDLMRAGAKVKDGPFDARAYAGIQFEVFSKVSPVHLRVSFGDADTDPRGGVCDRNSTLSSTACSGDFGEELDVAPGTWVERRVSFGQAAIPAWSKLQAAIDHGLRKDAIYSVHFSLRPDQDKVIPFDLMVANVFFFL